MQHEPGFTITAEGLAYLAKYRFRDYPTKAELVADEAAQDAQQ